TTLPVMPVVAAIWEISAPDRGTNSKKITTGTLIYNNLFFFIRVNMYWVEQQKYIIWNLYSKKWNGSKKILFRGY
ncbi:MAG: hypothetical protein OIN66_06005, partial [Candidatus Methanoperedens sp.]|nr:hypothetical protein [Candidatus Methanoperedens sp.]